MQSAKCKVELLSIQKKIVKRSKIRYNREYLKSFPQLEGKYGVYFCDSADGVEVG